MKKFLLISLALLLAISMVALSLGCPTEEEQPPAEEEEEEQPPAEEEEEEEGPQYGGILRLREYIPYETPFGDPLSIVGGATMRASLSLERLFLPGEQAGTFKPVLATGFELASDQSYYDIFLREGVMFHDGTPFNAEAAKWNLDRVLDAERSELRTVSSIEVISEYTIRLNLTSWNSLIMSDLLSDGCYMISPTAFEANGGSDWANYNPVGTGAFVFKGITDRITWERNDNYWQEGLPYLDGIEEFFIQDRTVANAALLAREIDASRNGDATQEWGDDFTIFAFDTDFLGYIVWNSVDAESVWSDVRMRQAFEYAIDKNLAVELSQVIYPLAQAQPMYNCIKGLEKSVDFDIEPRLYDQDKARELMALAGHEDGVEFNMYIADVLWPAEGLPHFLAWQEQLAEVGLIMHIEPIETARRLEFAGHPMPGNDIRFDAMRGYTATPARVVLETLSEETIYAPGVKRPDEWASLWAQVLATDDPAEQISLLKQMDEIAYAECMFIPLTDIRTPGIYYKTVHNFILDKQGEHLETCWLSEE